MLSTLKLPEPVLIKSNEDLFSLTKTLNHQKIVAVDTESNSLYAYQEQVCLIQFSTSARDFLVDPISIKNLEPLSAFFANPLIEKIFHAAEYDLICLKSDFGFKFQNLFDTMIAARILGKEEVGLGSMLESEFKIKLDKRFQRANWGQRPLPKHLLTYAQLDTHYLIDLRHKLYKELEKRQLLPLAQEDFNRCCQVNGRNHEHKNHGCWHINGAHDLTPQKATVLKELCGYRNQVARAKNLPIFKIISDPVLLKIAETCPRNTNELASIPGMTKRQFNRYGEAILNLVLSGLKGKPIHPERAPRPKEDYLSRLENLRNWRKITARGMGVQSDVILPRTLMHNLAESNPKCFEDLQTIMKDVPWRLNHFGSQILEVLANA